ncbi:hypothetical protein [Cetobacterium sp.]|uniref:hypothetical protein n=1 Tax=Cetobacterium sp. TaxID=2071632 RepID=UPI002FCA68B0
MPLPTFLGNAIKESLNNINYTFSMNQFINAIEKESKIYNARNNINNKKNHHEFYKKINAYQTIYGLHIKDEILLYKIFDLTYKKGEQEFENAFFKVDLKTFEVTFKLGNSFNYTDYNQLYIESSDRKTKEKIINSFYSWYLNKGPKRPKFYDPKYEPDYVNVWKVGSLKEKK